MRRTPPTEDAALLHGWGRTAPTLGHLHRPADDADVIRQVRAAADVAGAGSAGSAAGRGLLARGMGRSYGDAAQRAGGVVLDMTGHDRVRAIDLESGTVEVDAGLTLDRLLRLVLPLGLTVPVQPGTRQVTLGGAVACDVHGKNHHRAGSLGSHVRSLVLATADGETRRLAPDGTDGDLFWATVGGMGLTGVVLRVELALRRVETSRVVVRSERRPDLPAVMDALRERDAEWEHTVAWFDSLATGRAAGRGVVLSGNDATVDDLPASDRPEPLALPGTGGVTAPTVPLSLVNRLSGRLFNEGWYRRAPRRPSLGVEHAFSFFQPLDGIRDWNRLYGPRGLVQYQLVVPDDAAQVVEDVVADVAASGHVSCLNVLKRFGPANPSPLSFATPGWTLALDFPVRPGLRALLARLDARVAEAGGRLYLAKDSRVAGHLLPAMYPRLDEFATLLRRVDPAGVFASDLSRRLDLHRRDPGGPT